MKKYSTFTKTRTIGDILCEVRTNASDPQKIFEKFPIKEVRQECLKYLARYEMDMSLAYWLEDQATGLLKINDEIGVEVISTFVFFEEETEFLIRAMKFAIDSQTHPAEGTLFSVYSCSKIITGRLFNERDPAIKYYEEMKTFLQIFFRDCISRLYNGYLEKDWHCASRALRVFVKAEDFTYVDTLDDIIRYFEKDRINPSPKMPVFSKNMHYAALLEARDILRNLRKVKEKAEADKDDGPF